MNRLTFLLGLALVACRPPAEEQVVARPTVLAADDTAVAERGTLTLGPRVAGTLEPAETAVIRAEIGGSLVRLSAEVGQTVTKGQVLAVIDNSAAAVMLAGARSGVAAAEQQLAVAENELNRVRRLKDAGALAQRDVELADAQVRAVQAQLDAARAQLAQAADQADATTIRSPIAGVVSVRSVGNGDVIAPGSPLFTVIEPSSLRLEGTVPAEELGLLKPGAKVRFSVRGVEGQTIDGELTRIAPAVDPATRQVKVLVTIPNPGGALLAGLFAEGRVVAEEREALIVPANTLRDVAGTTRVMRVRGDSVELVAVQVGAREREREQVEVLSGLEPGDVLVLAALELDAGAKVTLAAGGERVDQ